MQSKKVLRELSIFFLGTAVGILLIVCCAGVCLKTFLIEEYESPLPCRSVVRSFPDKAAEIPGWSVNRDHCMVSGIGKQGEERELVIYRLCNRQYALAMLEPENTRRIAAVLPCSFALYETAEGKTRLARLNTSLLSRLIGGIPGRVFAENILPVQEQLLNYFNFRKIR